MTLPPEELRTLLAEAVGGDKAALQQLLLFHYGNIERTIRSRYNSQLAGFADPDDLLQETLIKVHRSIGTYREREQGGFEAWLRTIAEHCVVDAVRRCGRQKRGGKARQVQDRSISLGESLDSVCDWVFPDSQLPDRSASRAEARKAIQVCVSQLPPVQREAVVAHYFEHLDTAEIAVRMNRTPGAVRELLRRSRDKLRELMGTASAWLSGH